MPARATRVALLLAAVSLGAGALALWLFPRAFPIVAIEHRIPRGDALNRADAFFRAHDLAAPDSRTAIRFRQDDSLLTFVDFSGGGPDTLASLVRGGDVAPFTWSVRAFTPRDAHEARVHLAPDGRVVGFQRKLAETDARPALSPDSAQRVAETILAGWLGEASVRWHLVATSYETRKTSARVDRTFTFERVARTIAAAPIRLDIVIAGDLPSLARPFVVIPESFSRRYGEMRSSNDLLSLIDGFGILAIVVAGIAGLLRYSREGRLRWRAPLVVGGVIGVLLVAAGLNELASNWYDYDTATSPLTFQLLNAAYALGGGLAMGAVVTITLAAAESLSREAFPGHLDWWSFWRYRGTREVAGRVAGGYAFALVAFAYVAGFYLLTRRYLGWWVPAALLDDPNQVATPLPWIGGIALSLQAGVWEEALFRAIPLSFLSLWVGTRPRRSLWMAAGVMVTALIFGFAHASYPSWPAYSRGVEIFLDACLWGVLFLRFGILVTVVAHFVYDLTLFGLFAAMGTALEYRITAAVLLLAVLAPAIAVAVRWMTQRGLVTAPASARAGAWVKVEGVAPAIARLTTASGMSSRARTVARVVVAAGVFAAIAAPRTPVLGPPFTAGRAQAVTVADSLLRARAIDPARWRRLSRTAAATDTSSAWPAFLRVERAESLATTLAATYATPAAWVVRYVRTDGSLAERGEEWRVRLRPDGAPFDMRHVVPENAAGATPSADEARRIARTALARERIDTTTLHEAKLDEVARPARRDVTITYTDSGTPLPGGARAQAWVSLAGAEPVLVRRGVELPEQFLRAERERQTARLAVAIVCGLLLVTLVIVGAVVVTRKRPSQVGDDVPGRRVLIAIVSSLAVLAVAQALDALPVTLFDYDTAVPWSTFVSAGGIGVAFSALRALAAAGLWLAVNGLRRRAGIPVFPDASRGVTAGDALLAGAALGSVFAVPGLLAGLTAHGIPSPPQTSLDLDVPWLAAAISAPVHVASIVPAVAIPALVARGLTDRASVRVALVFLFLVLLVGTALPLAPDGTVPPVGIALALGAIAALVAGVRAWGGLCVLTWVVAALTERVLSSVHVALRAPTGTEQVGGLLAVAASAALAWFVARSLSRSPSVS